MRILGIDPGLRITGYGVIDADGDSISLVEAGTITTEDSAPLEDRLGEIYRGVRSIISSLKPGSLAVEQLYSHYAHPCTAILMGHARGLIFLAASECGVEVASYSATKIKKALTGNGHASKIQVGRMIQSLFGLKEPPSPSDVSDALAAATCHCFALAHTGGRR
ncbi:MAG: crossover junction endodeoxyribonuclease RuvC [Planctomycetota bacterium]